MIKLNEIYIQEVIEEFGGQILPMEPYIGDKVKIDHLCVVCDNLWKAIPSDILQHKGCRVCSIKRVADSQRKTQEEYENQIYIISNGQIQVLGSYLGDSIKIMHRCLRCDIEWMVAPSSILGHGNCPKCSRAKTADLQRKDHSTYLEEVIEKTCGRVVPIEEYAGSHTKILHVCTNCGNEWGAAPTNVLRGRGCPSCSLSRGEVKIEKFLLSKGILFEKQKKFQECTMVRPLAFDFYLPLHNICIEYDGEQHFGPIDFFGGMDSYNVRMMRDELKNHYCETNNINLIRIAFTEYTIIEDILIKELNIIE